MIVVRSIGLLFRRRGKSWGNIIVKEQKGVIEILELKGNDP